ncbi:MAG: nuclear transport factor 2 family protein [Myxococcota bacterium]|nr:nuclear transport factor 2 family protein [Myxococcota bacterium]
MKTLDRYNEYFEAFEVAYDTDDWSGVEPFFTEDAVYEVTGSAALTGSTSGRDAVMARFKAGLDNLDRKFPIKRRIEVLDGVQEREGYVKIPGRVHYEIPGAPTLHLYMDEEAWFRGDRIERLVDTIPEEEAAKMAKHIAQYLA